MNRRIFVIAAALASLGTALLLVYLERYEREVSGGPSVAILSLIKPLDRGATLTDEVLGTRKVPVAYLEDRAVRATDRLKVQGLRTRIALRPQQGLMWTDIDLGREEQAELESLVAPGKRAVTVMAGGLGRASKLIRPGNYVDVIVTSRSANEKESAKVLLQRVLVLAVGEETRAKATEALGSGHRGDEPLTLSLNLEETQLVALALERGRLLVALRNARDPRIETEHPVLSSVSLSRVHNEPAVDGRPRARVMPIRIGSR